MKKMCLPHKKLFIIVPDATGQHAVANTQLQWKWFEKSNQNSAMFKTYFIPKKEYPL
jgi:hypothetical protein